MKPLVPIIPKLTFGEKPKSVIWSPTIDNKDLKLRQYYEQELDKEKTNQFHDCSKNFQNNLNPYVFMFHRLVASGQWDMCERLLFLLPAFPNNEYSQSPLTTAILYDQFEMLQQLLNQKAFKNIINRQDIFGRIPLHWACYLGQKYMVKLLLQVGSDFLVRDLNGNTAIDLLVAGKPTPASKSIFKLLLDNYAFGADRVSKLKGSVFYSVLKNKDIYGRTLLHWICYYKRLDLLQELIAHKSFGIICNDANADAFLQTPLHLVAQVFEEAKGLTLGSKVLSDLRSSPLISGKHAVGKSAKIARSIFDQLGNARILPKNAAEMAQLLLKHFNSKWITAGDSEKRTPLHFAASTTLVDLVSLLASHSLCTINETSVTGRTSLHHASINGNAQIMLTLLENGADDSIRDIYGATALHYLSAKNHGHCIQSVFDFFKAKSASLNNEDLQKKVQPEPAYLPDFQGRYALFWAVLKGNVQTCRVLVENQVRTDLRDAQGGTALHAAAYSGQTMCIFASSRQEFDFKDSLGETPLMKAVERGFVETAVALFLQGSTLESMVDNLGRYVAHHAALSGHLPVCAWLLTCNVNLDVTDFEGNSPTHIAAHMGYYDIVKLFADSGANVNIQNSSGHTPLFLACVKGHVKIVHFLVSNGAKLNMLDYSAPMRLTALDYTEDPELAFYFRTNGAWSGREIQQYAAQLIQKTVRGYQARKRMKSKPCGSGTKVRKYPEILVSAPSAVNVTTGGLNVKSFEKSLQVRPLVFKIVPQFIKEAAATLIQKQWKAYSSSKVYKFSKTETQRNANSSKLSATVDSRVEKKDKSCDSESFPESEFGSVDSITREYLKAERAVNSSTNILKDLENSVETEYVSMDSIPEKRLEAERRISDDSSSIIEGTKKISLDSKSEPSSLVKKDNAPETPNQIAQSKSIVEDLHVDISSSIDSITLGFIVANNAENGLKTVTISENLNGPRNSMDSTAAATNTELFAQNK